MIDNDMLAAIGQLMDEKLSKLEEGQGQLAERMTRLEVSYENNTQKILNLLQEDYSRVAAAAAKTGDYEEVKSTVSDHERALKNHNERLTELEKKAI